MPMSWDDLPDEIKRMIMSQRMLARARDAEDKLWDAAIGVTWIFSKRYVGTKLGLKARCARYGLKVSGRVVEMQWRIRDHLRQELAMKRLNGVHFWSVVA